MLSKLLPILLLIWSSLLPFFQLPSGRAFAFVSLNHYASLPWEIVFKALGNTLVLAVLVPTVTLAIALAFSWVVLRSRIRGRGAFDFIAFLPHAVPSIVFGVGALLLALFVLQRALPIYGTIWVLLVVFTIARISYGTRMTNSGLIQIHAELEESAQMSGATTWQGFRRISLPLLATKPEILAPDCTIRSTIEPSSNWTLSIVLVAPLVAGWSDDWRMIFSEV